jgi:hypothetical protein
MAAPKGNKYALGNSGGRPRIYSSPEQMMIEINDYFEHWLPGEYEEQTFITEEGAITKRVYSREPEPATVTGLCLYLGFSNRHTLDEYEKRDEFTHIIKYARMMVERAYENRLHGQAPTGAIFALKNMGWKDKTEQELNGNLGIVWQEEKTYKNPADEAKSKAD